MSQAFSTRITRCPRPYDIDRGKDALASMPELPGDLGDIICGAAGSSFHIFDLIRREGAWLAEALDGAPETALQSELSQVTGDGAKAIGSGLRRSKARLSLLIGLADLAGVWSLEEVTGALTRFADHAVQTALEESVAVELRRNKIPGKSEEDLKAAAGLSVLAMGKMGAHELNYSSDIDLICLFDETGFDPSDYGEARTAFVRAVRLMCKLLSERTADGYVFRTDLRLRPDASVTPVAISMEAAERYYEAFGRTWERAAYIKARPCAGDISAGERFLKTLTPFVWRRHLDYAAIQDAQDMRLRIRDHKKLHATPSHLRHDLKLGQGGIREIEFFTQTRQIISGGRDPALRLSQTVPALRRLAEKGWVSEGDAETLIADYRAHREAEHRVQMIADQQTHKLPDTEDDFARLAALAGVDAPVYARDIVDRLTRVAALTEGFFKPEASASQPTAVIEGAKDIVDRWAGYPALRSPRAVEIFKRVWPHLQSRLAKAEKPDEALRSFDGFLKGLPAGVQVFSLFEANPQLLDLVVNVVDTAPGLGQYLARNAGVFDAVIGGAFFSPWPGVDKLRTDLEEGLGSCSDYEAKLDLARIWAREWHFRVGVHHLRGLIDAEQSGQQYADLAGAVVQALWPEVVAQFALKHGAPPGRGAAVLAMGSLGGERLNAASDLDLIVIYDGQGIETSEGPRPLPTRTYFARLTQALVTALSAPTAEGRLYEVDMRLRPSGRQGPVATSFEAFCAYQRDEAWTWEHLALTRARALVGDRTLCADIETFRSDLLAAPKDRKKVLADVAEMRARLATAKPAKDALDTRSGGGRLQDIEMFFQAGTLISGGGDRRIDAQMAAAAQAFQLPKDDYVLVKEAARLFWNTQAAKRLVFAEALESTDLGTGALSFLLRDSGVDSQEMLVQTISEMAARVDRIVTRHIGTPDPSG